MPQQARRNGSWARFWLLLPAAVSRALAAMGISAGRLAGRSAGEPVGGPGRETLWIVLGHEEVNRALGPPSEAGLGSAIPGFSVPTACCRSWSGGKRYLTTFS